VSKPRTLEDFLQWDQPEGSPYKYEWVNGHLEKAEYMMKNTERGLVNRIQRAFMHTQGFAEGGNLFAETKVKLSDMQVRIPDLAYFTKAQIESSEQGGHPIPKFVIEVISVNDKISEVEKKVLEYFEAGVQTIWHIFPELQIVRVSVSPKEIKVCTGEDECSAQPAIPDLAMKVNDIFNLNP
jgi:Uma2 family endonuclease